MEGKGKLKYNEPKGLDLPAVDREIHSFWKDNKIFEQSISSRSAENAYIFYEGPPSANGLPGIHHVMSRTIKDLICRYKTLQGFRVERKGGWDTHGLPVEISVERKLGISKVDIGEKISVAEYNRICREEVLKYKDHWDKLTREMGYWVDLHDPYITFEPRYIETLWFLLSELYKKNLLYKGYTIQPFSPAAGTGLSTHELNQPGAYRDVKDTSAVAQFKIAGTEDEFFLAWTTTPWTLPSNTALAVGKNISYLKVETFNPYTYLPVKVILAKDLASRFFREEGLNSDPGTYTGGDKVIPWKVIEEMKGSDLIGIRYEQLFKYAVPEDGDAFIVISGDFVSTEDGTGIVHIAPSFGADDLQVARENGIGSLTLVDKEGKFTEEAGEFSGRYVKDFKDDPNYVSVDIDIAVKMKLGNRAFKIEKYEHSYPHCWRTDKPIIYYPLDSWFIRTTAVKDRLIELNKQINWKPSSTGEGRFGKWLENLMDWNLSRSRYWGTPLPIWRTEDSLEEICIGSFDQLRKEVDKAVEAGFMKEALAPDFDPHRPHVDEITLVSSKGEKMMREPDLIDVWFDSGAMPYAQWHYPFENQDTFKKSFPADFIAEGVDQTRGWFFTLHAVATMISDSVAFKNVISNGLVLDKNGEKMSKRLGNAVDPFETLETYGADATRWYIISNSQPWDNLKFDNSGIEEVRRKFFGTLYNTYSFFALYANIDEFTYEEAEVSIESRQEIDRWIISLLNTLIRQVNAYMDDYEPTKAVRAIQTFVTDHLSNWYVRLCRRRFWKGEMTEDKVAAYQTLYTCLETISRLIAPVAPFFSDYLFQNLNKVTQKSHCASVHLESFPAHTENLIDTLLEERMQLAQDITSMVLSLRKKENIKVRQPLNKILIPVLDDGFKGQVEKVKDLILSELNIKDIEYIDDTAGVITKKIKPNFKKLGPKFGSKMKEVSKIIGNFSQQEIVTLEKNGEISVDLNGFPLTLSLEDVEIGSEDIPGWQVASSGTLTVALDVHVSEDLKEEGLAREFVNKVQRIRKDSDFNVTDRILVTVEHNDEFDNAVIKFKDYICNEILAEQLIITKGLKSDQTLMINDVHVKVLIMKK